MVHKRCEIIKQGDTENQNLNLNLMNQLSKSVDEFNKVFTGKGNQSEDPSTSKSGEVSDVIFKKIQSAALELFNMDLKNQDKI